MGLLYSESRIRKQESKTENTGGSNLIQDNQNADPILIQAIQILKKNKWEKYQDIQPSDFCFRVENILSLSIDANRKTKAIEDIIYDIQRIYDEIKN